MTNQRACQMQAGVKNDLSLPQVKLFSRFLSKMEKNEKWKF